MEKQVTAILTSALLLCLLTGCKDRTIGGGQSDDSSQNDVSQSSSYLSNSSTDITSEDIEQAVKFVIDENIVALDTAVQDIDFDGENELLVLSSWGKNEIHLFRKHENEIFEADTFGIGMLDYIDKLDLIPCEDNGEKFCCFEFHFDNGGVMSADVVGAIKNSDSSFHIEYLLSKGQLNYSDIETPVSKDFFRLGWSQYDVELDGVFNDITENEYNEIYNRLMNSQLTD